MLSHKIITCKEMPMAAVGDVSTSSNCPRNLFDDIKNCLKLEQEYLKKEEEAPVLMLRFPDPELNIDLVKSYSDDIAAVHFQQSSAPRYCFVHLKPTANVDTAIEHFSKIPFGNGFITAELKRPHTSAQPDDLDPYTLYVGNLPRSMATKQVKQYFTGAKRVDVGYAHRMKNTRFAFVQYGTVEAAMEAFTWLTNTEIDSRTLIVRFKRNSNKQFVDDKVCPNSVPFGTTNPLVKRILDDCGEPPLNKIPKIEQNRGPEKQTPTVLPLNNEIPKIPPNEASVIRKAAPPTMLPLLPIRIKQEIIEQPAENLSATAETTSTELVAVKTEPFDIFDYFDITKRSSIAEPRLSPQPRSSANTSNPSKSFIRQLQIEVQRAKYAEEKPRVRDELDDIFAKMSSDVEEEEDF